MSAPTDNEAAPAGPSSGVTPEQIQARLKAKLDATYIEINDKSGGCGQMYETIIVSSQFANKRSLQRHRAVNTALKQEIAAMHAWTAQCYTPEEWEKNKPQ